MLRHPIRLSRFTRLLSVVLVSVEADPVPLPAPPLRHRRWIPVAALAVVLAAVTSGGYLTADALGEVRGGAVEVERVGPCHAVPRLGARRSIARSRTAIGSRAAARASTSPRPPFDGTDVDLLARYVDNDP